MPTITQEIEVDIATRTVADDEDIYIVRPGAAYALYHEFQATSRVFLDFPGLGVNLEQKPLPANLRMMIARSLDTRDWLLSDRSTTRPSDDLRDYINKTKMRKFGRYAAAIEKLYYELPVGTIIVVPGPGYISDVMIGVLTGPPVIADNIRAYPGEAIPVREVRWVTSKQRAAFSPGLRDRLGNSHPVMALDRSMRGEILEAGFDRFIFAGRFQVRLETTRSEFNTLDDYDIQSFVNYVAGALAAKEGGATQDGALDMSGAIQALRAHPDLIPELAANINSPGYLRMASDRIAPLVIAVLFFVALAMPATATGTPPPNIVVSNSAAGPSDPCAVNVSDEARGAMKLMLYDEWLKACEKARDAHASTGVKTNMHTTVHPAQPN